MIPRPPRSTRTDTPGPYTTLVLSERLSITDEVRPSAQPRLLEAGVVECDKGAGGGVFDGWSGKRPGYGRAQADVAPAHVREQRLGLQQDRVDGNALEAAVGQIQHAR